MYMDKECQLTQTFSLISYQEGTMQVYSFSWIAMIRLLPAWSGNYVQNSLACFKSEFLNQPHYVDLFLETSMTDCSTSEQLWIFYFPCIYIPAVKWQNSTFITDLLSFIGEVWYYILSQILFILWINVQPVSLFPFCSSKKIQTRYRSTRASFPFL